MPGQQHKATSTPVLSKMYRSAVTNKPFKCSNERGEGMSCASRHHEPNSVSSRCRDAADDGDSQVVVLKLRSTGWKNNRIIAPFRKLLSSSATRRNHAKDINKKHGDIHDKTDVSTSSRNTKRKTENKLQQQPIMERLLSFNTSRKETADKTAKDDDSTRSKMLLHPGSFFASWMVIHDDHALNSPFNLKKKNDKRERRFPTSTDRKEGKKETPSSREKQDAQRRHDSVPEYLLIPTKALRWWKGRVLNQRDDVEEDNDSLYIFEDGSASFHSSHVRHEDDENGDVSSVVSSLSDPLVEVDELEEYLHEQILSVSALSMSGLVRASGLKPFRHSCTNLGQSLTVDTTIHQDDCNNSNRSDDCDTSSPSPPRVPLHHQGSQSWHPGMCDAANPAQSFEFGRVQC